VIAIQLGTSGFSGELLAGARSTKAWGAVGLSPGGAALAPKFGKAKTMESVTTRQMNREM
jgi:hypothetical protein